jgi:aryl-alcohol dehydrogenase-like predicted oxidoreductase
MNYRTLGRTGLDVSALALGTVELGIDYGIQAPGHFGRPEPAAATRLVHAALDSGINLVDTARAYGESETLLGSALAGRRDRLVIATKTGTRAPDGTPLRGDDLRRHMLDQLEISLRLLRMDCVDIWQLHSVAEPELAQAETIADTFRAAKQAGKIRYSGGSFYGAALPEAALALDAEFGLFDVIQITYSIFDQRLVDRVFPLAQERGVGVLARSVLLKGALTERADFLPDHLEPLRAHSRRYRQTLADLGLSLTPAQAALAFALAEPHIHSILVGVRTQEELRDNLAALRSPLSSDAFAALAALRLDDENLLNPGTWGIP